MRIAWSIAAALAALGLAGCPPQLGLAAWEAADAGDDTEPPFEEPPEGAYCDLAELMPRQVHLSWQGDPRTTLTAAWQTGATAGYAPQLWIAPAAACTASEDGIELPFGPGYVFAGSGAPFESGGEQRVLWIAEATGLAPGTDYFYRVGTWAAVDEEDGAPRGACLGPARAHRTAPTEGPGAAFSFAVGGDSHGGHEELALCAGAVAETAAADFWLLSGDMVAWDAAAQWDDWFAAIAPIAGAAPLMPVRGNHEGAGAVFLAEFALPVAPGLAPEQAETAWSFDYGNAHFIGLDSLTEATVAGLDAWLEADLAAAAADPDVLWKIAVFHHPAYSASPAHGSTPRVLEHWVPLFEEHGLDLALCGHDHDYERTVPILAGAAAAPGGGVTYVVNGAFFAPLYPAGADWWTAFSASVDSYVTVAIDGAQLHLVARRAADQTVLDELVLSK